MAAQPEPAPRRVAIIGAALDLGQGRRGVDMGPSAIRYAGLEARLRALGYEVTDQGNVPAPVVEAGRARGPLGARYLPEVKATCERIASRVFDAVTGGAVPLVLGGDHSVAIGTLGGLSKAFGPGGVLWIDAHGDLNTPTSSPSGNVHGMVLAAALGARPHLRERRVGAPDGRAEPRRARRRPRPSTTASGRSSASWRRRCSR